MDETENADLQSSTAAAGMAMDTIRSEETTPAVVTLPAEDPSVAAETPSRHDIVVETKSDEEEMDFMEEGESGEKESNSCEKGGDDDDDDDDDEEDKDDDDGDEEDEDDENEENEENEEDDDDDDEEEDEKSDAGVDHSEDLSLDERHARNLKELEEMEGKQRGVRSRAEDDDDIDDEELGDGKGLIPHTKNELTSLPPVEYKDIHLEPNTKIVPIGAIHAVVEDLVIVVSDPIGSVVRSSSNNASNPLLTQSDDTSASNNISNSARVSANATAPITPLEEKESVLQNLAAPGASSVPVPLAVQALGVEIASRGSVVGALDIGSLLCYEDRRVIGEIFETFGPVTRPYYSIRVSMNHIDVIKSEAVEGRMVCFVPDKSSFLLTHQLRLMKGSDASNLDDEEPGEDEVEFSDDEKEMEYKSKIQAKKKSSKRARAAAGAAASGGQGDSAAKKYSRPESAEQTQVYNVLKRPSMANQNQGIPSHSHPQQYQQPNQYQHPFNYHPQQHHQQQQGYNPYQPQMFPNPMQQSPISMPHAHAGAYGGAFTGYTSSAGPFLSSSSHPQQAIGNPNPMYGGIINNGNNNVGSGGSSGTNAANPYMMAPTGYGLFNSNTAGAPGYVNPFFAQQQQQQQQQMPSSQFQSPYFSMTAMPNSNQQVFPPPASVHQGYTSMQQRQPSSGQQLSPVIHHSLPPRPAGPAPISHNPAGPFPNSSSVTALGASSANVMTLPTSVGLFFAPPPSLPPASRPPPNQFFQRTKDAGSNSASGPDHS